MNILIVNSALKVTFLLLLTVVSGVCNAYSYSGNSLHGPIAIDNRIKTFIYSENEIFSVVMKVGYQTIFQFDPEENIKFVALGDPYPWKITPVGAKLFIKALDPGMMTNMTIVTSKRIYLMEISSVYEDDSFDDRLAYVVRFFYSDNVMDDIPISERPAILSGKLEAPSTRNATKLEEVAGGVVFENQGINFNYTFAGASRDITPVKVYDDGLRTYIMFRNDNAIIPAINAVSKKGDESLLKYHIQDGYVVVEYVGSRLALRLGSHVVCVFNEEMG